MEERLLKVLIFLVKAGRYAEAKNLIKLYEKTLEETP